MSTETDNHSTYGADATIAQLVKDNAHLRRMLEAKQLELARVQGALEAQRRAYDDARFAEMDKFARETI